MSWWYSTHTCTDLWSLNHHPFIQRAGCWVLHLAIGWPGHSSCPLSVDYTPPPREERLLHHLWSVCSSCQPSIEDNCLFQILRACDLPSIEPKKRLCFTSGWGVGGKDHPRFSKECLDTDVNTDFTSKGWSSVYKRSSHRRLCVMCNDCSGHPIALGAIDNVFGTNRDLPWRPLHHKNIDCKLEARATITSSIGLLRTRTKIKLGGTGRCHLGSAWLRLTPLWSKMVKEVIWR